MKKTGLIFSRLFIFKSLGNYLTLVILLLFYFGSHVEAYAFQSGKYQLVLSDSKKEIENKISFEISSGEYEYLTKITGEKINLRTKSVVINGVSYEPEEIHTRGQTTLSFRRKSLSLHVQPAASFYRGEESTKLKKFALLNLSMDKYYTRNRLAFGMMENLEIFDLYYSFCELRINGNSEGLYLVTEHPDDWGIHQDKAPFVIRRGYNHQISKIKTDKKVDRSEQKKYIDSYKQTYKSLTKYQGEDLYQTVSQWMDLDNYMKWLAFNFFVKNGDYSDEVFFYIEPAIGKFRIIPWDYDDIFSKNPHEGKEAYDKAIVDKLIFSSEDALDVKIANDPYLYERYLGILKGVLERLTPEVIQQVFEATYAELFPYYSDKEIISNAQYDLYKNADIESLKLELISNYNYLIMSREALLHQLSDIPISLTNNQPLEVNYF